jgi:hypothetical protein
MRCKALLKNSGRVAYTIFVNDVDYSIQFMHPSLLSLGMIKLPLPCAPALWEAQNATEWVRHMEETRRASYAKNLRDSIEFLLRDHCEHSRQRQRETLHMYGSSAFTLQVLIHGLASAVLEHKFRSVDSQCTSSLHVLKQRDFEQGLGCWYRCFQHMNHSRSSGNGTFFSDHLSPCGYSAPRELVRYPNGSGNSILVGPSRNSTTCPGCILTTSQHTACWTRSLSSCARGFKLVSRQ